MGIIVFVASPVYTYREHEGMMLEGMMLEKSLSLEFLANSHKEAIDKAIAWAKDRYENYIKDSYKESFFSSIKVYTKEIGFIDEDGTGHTKNHMFFFEWKHDWPGTLEQYVAKAIWR